MVKRTRALLFASAAICMTATRAPAQSPQEQETDLPGVTARLLSVRRHESVMVVAIALRNTGSADATASAALDFSKFVLVDSVGGTKHFALKDQNGHYLAGPVSDWNGGGRWFPVVPGRGARTVFAMFEPLKAGTKANVQVPMLPPFDDLDLDAIAGRPSADADVPRGAFTGTDVSAVRANNQLKLRVKITHASSGFVGTAALKYSDVSVLDPATRRQYGLLKDRDGHWIAQPASDTNEGGRYFLSAIPVNGQVFLNLTFTPPPDTVRSVLLLLPLFIPSEPIEIQGTSGAAETGASVAGRTIGLDQALSDLKADVTPQQIKITLSADVLFDFDKADLKFEAEASLAELVAVIKAYPNATTDVEGHTDGKGTDAYNQTLSERRAAAVAQWLIARGNLAAVQVRTRGLGKTRPIAPNAKPDGSDDPDGRAKNRRVEIIVKK